MSTSVFSLLSFFLVSFDGFIIALVLENRWSWCVGPSMSLFARGFDYEHDDYSYLRYCPDLLDCNSVLFAWCSTITMVPPLWSPCRACGSRATSQGLMANNALKHFWIGSKRLINFSNMASIWKNFFLIEYSCWFNESEEYPLACYMRALQEGYSEASWPQRFMESLWSCQSCHSCLRAS